MAAEGAAAAAVAAGAFGYNRENYLYDAEFRWERFASGREYANQQADQYRDDIRKLAAHTVKKNTLWCVTCTLNMALDVALYCAGRLGLHGPSPPAWIMGLWLTNNAASFAFMALCIFLALHASFRAQAAATQILTRKTRVPIPTLKQLDDARRFASEFEQQSWRDILRVPYITNNGAPKTDDAVYGGRAEARGSSSRSRSAPGRGKCSSWVKQEFATDRALKADEPELPEDAAPEHFELFKQVQKEYYQYDIYARVCIFYGFIHYVQSLCFYGLGHINIELRAFWVAYATVFVIAVLMALLLRFDIIPANPGRKQYLPRCEYLGPLAVLPAAIAMSLDFAVEFDPTTVAVCWLFIFIAYILQLIYALRMLEVVLPDETFAGVGERLGASFLPEGWRKVPSTFYHVLYFVAPPTKLQPGQHDLVREIKRGGGGAYDEVLGGSSRQSGGEALSAGAIVPLEPLFPDSASKTEPWRLVATIAGVLPIAWVFLICGTVVDVAIGEQALVTAPHWSRPPMTRLSKEPHELGTPLGFPWPAGDKPFLPEQMAWHEEKRHADMFTMGRRLSAQPAPKVSKAALSSALQGLLDAIPTAGAPLIEAPVSWPAFFEPRLLACGQDGRVSALTPRGFGASAAPGDAAAAAFQLAGLAAYPPLAGAAAEGDGLLVVTRAGHVLACAGPHARSSCAPAAGGRLPIAEDARLAAATAGTLGGRLHAAVVHEGELGLVAIFAHEEDAWLPLGEVRVPGGGGAAPSVSFVAGAELLVTTGDGHVLRRRLADGAVTLSARHRVAQEGAEWQGACALERPGQDPRYAHLRLRKAGHAWRPELFTAEAETAAPPVQFA